MMIKVRTEGMHPPLGHGEAVSLVREAELTAEIIGGLLDAKPHREGSVKATKVRSKLKGGQDNSQVTRLVKTRPISLSIPQRLAD